jgi:tRNA-splicing ligase RtcB
MSRWFIDLPDPNLAYLVQGTPEFRQYVADMQWAQRYAFGSRQAMMTAAETSLFEVVGRGAVTRTINCHHNFAQLEHHLGQDVWITRKGAIKAGVGDLGVIPGRWGRAPTSSRGSATRRRTTRARTGPAGGCPESRRGAS